MKEYMKLSAYMKLSLLLFLSHTHMHTDTYTLSMVWLEQTGSAAGQPVPLHISVIHPCHSGQDHEGGVEWWMAGKERLAWLTFNCHTVALCSPIASSRGHLPPSSHTLLPFFSTSALRPWSLLLQHGSVLKRTHGKGQTDPRLPGPHQTWPGTEGREGARHKIVCVHMSKCRLSELDWICRNFEELET